jgi:hypothetical protein
MTARQQIARLLPLVLLVALVIAGLRGTVSAPRWTGPLRAEGVAIGIALEVIFGAALVAVRIRDAAARRAAEAQPYTAEMKEIEPAGALRFTLKYVLVACMIAIGVVLISDLHLHFFTKPHLTLPKVPAIRSTERPPTTGGGGSTFHIPIGPILYGLLIAVLVAAVVISIWWSSRLRRPAAPLVIEDVDTEELQAAVAEGRAALQAVDDARAAIIACYVAMERSLADRGTARTAADTPDELLARAVASGTVRGTAAGSLTALFYEARFSTHPLSADQRDAARAALDAISAELAAVAAERAARQAAQQAAQSSAQSSAGQSGAGATRPGGGWV